MIASMPAVESMPTNKQRLTLNLPPEMFAALEACAARANRTLANQAAIAIGEFLLKSGDLQTPVQLAGQGRPRGKSKQSSADEEPIADAPETTGKRGRKPKADEGTIESTDDG